MIYLDIYMYYCDVCDKEFKTEASLQKHFESHTHKINVKFKEFEEEIQKLTKENKSLAYINKDLTDNKMEKMKHEIEQLRKENKSLILENENLRIVKNNFNDNIIEINNEVKLNTDTIDSLKKSFSNIKYLFYGELGAIFLIFALKEFYVNFI